jgi:hypothetical protein
MLLRHAASPKLEPHSLDHGDDVRCAIAPWTRCIDLQQFAIELYAYAAPQLQQAFSLPFAFIIHMR